jgi:hypothetical protein
VPLPAADASDAAATATCLSSVAAGVPFPCVVGVSGLGEAPPPFRVEVRIPPGLLHVAHDAAGRFDADRRTLTFTSTPDGQPRAFHYELVAGALTSGWTTRIDATLRVDGPASFERQAEASVAVDRQARFDLGYLVLPIAPLWVFFALTLWVPLGLGLVWTLRRSRRALARAPRRPGYPPVPRDSVMAPAFFSLLCVPALLILSPALVESVRSRTAYTETRCTVLDRASTDSPAGDQPPPTSTAVVRYATPSGPRVSIGFDVRGTMGLLDNRAAHQAFAVGGVYPCWIDPQRPDRVVLRRGWSGNASLFVLCALALFRLLLAVWRAWRR